MQAEMLDQPRDMKRDLPANLRDIRFLNRWFGGTGIALHAVRTMLATPGEATLLDVATGSADIPLAILRGMPPGAVSITALDVSPEVLAEAERLVSGAPIGLVCGDARSLPFGDASFDLVTCCLALHHFDPDDAVQVLSEMWRVTRRGIVVIDLVRSYPAWIGTWIATHTVARNPITRHDGPLSVLRAYACDEILALARSAGIEHSVVRQHTPFRQSLLARRGVS